MKENHLRIASVKRKMSRHQHIKELRTTLPFNISNLIETSPKMSFVN